jgi:hypothetical protein
MGMKNYQKSGVAPKSGGKKEMKPKKSKKK